MTERWHFTFGQTHTHSYNGVTLDKNSVLEVIGSCDETRARMFELFGPKWSMQYKADGHDLKYFPRGVVAIIDATK